jgi:hypothetical protein
LRYSSCISAKIEVSTGRAVDPTPPAATRVGWREDVILDVIPWGTGATPQESPYQNVDAFEWIVGDSENGPPGLLL